jgi:plastocyanin
VNPRQFLYILVCVVLISGCSKKQEDEPIVLSAYKIISVSNGGNIQGKVIHSDNRPSTVSIEIQKDQDICGASHHNPSAIGNDSGVRGCIVYLEHVSQGKSFSAMKHTLDQHGCDFIPHVQAVPLGASMIVSNSDAVLHNYHIRKGELTISNEAQPNGSPEREVEMKTSGLLSISCDVHPWMKGYILVAENPYYAVTDSLGVFTISDIPPGDYVLSLWRDNWNVEQVKDAEGRIQSYKWGNDFTEKQQVHIDAGRAVKINFTLP